MLQRTENETSGDELFLAGQRVLPGLYREIGGNRQIRIEAEDVLPASLDGRVACYMRVNNLWSQISERKKLSA